jgi:hypothetical protein
VLCDQLIEMVVQLFIQLPIETATEQDRAQAQADDVKPARHA